MIYFLEDTRNKQGHHEQKHADFERMQVGIVRTKLPHGDYAYPPKCAIDTKENIFELCQNIKSDHARFRAECINARDVGTKLVVLTENTEGVRTLNDLRKWQEPWEHYMLRRAKSKRTKPLRWQGETIAKACLTMEQKYGVAFRFCTPFEAASKIKLILDWGETLDRIV